jgi:pimeloyl-ACP methyl ester carboxylesterase
MQEHSDSILFLQRTLFSMTFKHTGFLFVLTLTWGLTAHAQIPVYLIPGQGADERLYNNLDLGSDYELKHIRFFTPEVGMQMREYAYLLSRQIDTTQPFILIGTSLGGMLATEMSTFLKPEKVIIISSAKTRKELPLHYRFQKYIELNNLIPAQLTKWGAQILQPLVEPDREKHKEIFVSMLQDKDPLFLSRTVEMIINWEREEIPRGIIHVHGEQDHTLPIKNVQPNHVIKGGSHMMVLTRGEEISQLILEILED